MPPSVPSPSTHTPRCSVELVETASFLVTIHNVAILILWKNDLCLWWSNRKFTHLFTIIAFRRSWITVAIRRRWVVNRCHQCYVRKSSLRESMNTLQEVAANGVRSPKMSNKDSCLFRVSQSVCTGRRSEHNSCLRPVYNVFYKLNMSPLCLGVIRSWDGIIVVAWRHPLALTARVHTEGETFRPSITRVHRDDASALSRLASNQQRNVIGKCKGSNRTSEQ